jgi:hypothetical protein
MYRKAYFFQYDVDESISDRWAEVQYLKERADSLKEDLENLREEEAATAKAVEAATESEE